MQSKGASTLKDIAREAGVSLATASVVVNGSRFPTGVRVADSTRARVLAVAENLHYSPNVLARGLKRIRLNSLGISFHYMNPVDAISDSYGASVLKGIIGVAHPMGYNVTHFHKPWRDAKQSAAGFRDQGIDGFLIVAPVPESDLVSGLSALNIPLVVISSSAVQHGVPSVDVDNAKGVRLAVEHLLGLGHRRIAHLMDDVEHFDTFARRDSFLAIMAERGVDVPPTYLRAGVTAVDVYEYTLDLLSLPEPPTALFTTNDWVAMEAMHAARDLGIRIPEQLSIVGFDDTPGATSARPPLTTVRHPVQEMAELATRLLISLVEGEAVPAETRWFEPELVIRDSTAAMHGGVNASSI